MFYNTSVNVVHKKPAEDTDAFSATLFSGAKYRYDKPEDWKALVDMFLGEINCSCVGFTSYLELADEVASNIINIVSKTKA